MDDMLRSEFLRPILSIERPSQARTLPYCKCAVAAAPAGNGNEFFPPFAGFPVSTGVMKTAKFSSNAVAQEYEHFHFERHDRNPVRHLR